jgi:hypothetical protein
MSAEIVDFVRPGRPTARNVMPGLPLPVLPPVVPGDSPDAALINAEADIARLDAYLDAVREKRELHDEEEAPIYDRDRELDWLIAETAPETLAGCAVKLRRLLDRQVGIDTGKSDQDIPSLLQVYEFIERMTGKPQHPTSPLVDLAEYE